MDVTDFLNDIIPIQNAELREYLKAECSISTYDKGDFINEIGMTDKYVRFLVKGVVRGYIIDPRGKEITTSFITKPGDVIAGSRMLDGSPSEIGFKVIKRSEVFSVPVDVIMNSRTKYSEIMDIQMYMLCCSSLYHWETKKMLYLKTARERYDWFLEHYPGLIDCVVHSDIASFLNVTPVTLSRIRHG